MSAPLVVVGDTVLDRDIEGTVERVCPDAPAPVCDVAAERSRPGGAGLAAIAAARHGPVTLITGIARDAAGELLAELLAERGVELVALPLDGTTPEKVRVRSGAQTLVRLDRGTEVAPLGVIPQPALARLRDASAVLVSDYGRGVTSAPALRAAMEEAARRAPFVWDPHPRGAAPVAGAHLVTPSGREAAMASCVPGDDALAAIEQGRALVERWAARAVAVTLGARGAVLAGRGRPPLYVPAEAVAGDACGAGDVFATSAARALAEGALVSEAVERAVHAATEYVRAGGIAAVTAGRPDTGVATDATDGSVPDAERLARTVRKRGGTCVATGGCFDLLHAGHVSMLRAARRLGDCLVVCLNSDASVRRLKGDDRPRQTAPDRAAVLLALDCVDAVVVFDEDTPIEVLRRIQPHVFAKGADYDVAALPETAVVAEWGGRTVALPYLSGRSTTRLLTEVAHDGT